MMNALNVPTTKRGVSVMWIGTQSTRETAESRGADNALV